MTLQQETTAELQSRRAAIHREGRALLRRITDRTSEAQAREIEARFNEKMMEMDEISDELAERRDAAIVDRVPVMRDATASGTDVRTDDHSDAFKRWLGSPANEQRKRQLTDVESRTASGLTNAAGGFIVPEQINNNLMMRMRDQNTLRQLVRVIQVRTGDVVLPLSNADATSGWIGETGTRADQTEPTLEGRSPTFGMNYSYLSMSEEIVMSAVFDIEDWFLAEVSAAMGEAESDAIISGSGTNRPTGILNTAPEAAADGSRTDLAFKYLPSTTAATMGTDDAETADNLTDLIYDLRAGYRARGTFVMNSATAGVIRKLRDSQGRHLWADGLAQGQPNLLLGYPVVINESMEDIGADAHPVAFGDWYRAYTLCLHDRLHIQNKDQNITVPGLHKLYVRQRVGGIAYDENALRFLKCAAS